MLALFLLFSSGAYAKKIEQTVCFSKASCTEKYSYASIGDAVNLCGGACQGKSLVEMNKEGWRLIQVIGGLSGSFGMLMTKEK